MRVLLVEASPGAAGEIAELMEDAGHTTLRCQDGGDCSLVGIGGCPLVDGHVDVVVDVRSVNGPFAPREQPLVCGILAGVPTVVCGPVPEASDEPSIWQRADVRCHPAGIVEAIEEATLPTSPTVRHRIAGAVTAVLRRRGLVAPFRVAVRNRQGAVDVHLEFVERVPPPAVREQLRVVVRAVLIPVTGSWASADILIFESPPPTGGTAGGVSSAATVAPEEAAAS